MTQLLVLSDTTLIDRLKQGDKAAFDELFRFYYKYLVVVAHKYLNDRDGSRDMVQDVFLDLWKRREEVHIDQSAKFFLRRAVINKCLASKRKSDRITVNTELVNIDKSAVDSTTDQVAFNDINAFVNQIIEGLPKRCREVFILSRKMEMSHKEIAAKLNISTKTIENQMTKALKVMRLELKSKGFLSIIGILLSQL